MKKYKIVFLLILLVVLTGCTGKYNINIKSNGKVEEEFIIEFDSSKVDSNNASLLIEDTIKNYRQNGMYNDYKIKKEITKGKSTITARRTYNSFKDYINKSELLPILFEKTLDVDDYGIKGLQTTGEYYYDALFEEGVDEDPQFDSIDINVHSHFELLENNALKIDNETNTMYWNLDRENKKVSFEFKFNNSKRYDIIIKDYLKENWYSILVVLVIIIATIVIINYIKKQDKQNNKI